MPKKSHIHEADVTRWFFIIMSTLTLVVFWFIIEPYVITLVTAAVAAIVLTPVDRWLRAIVKNRHVSSILIVIGFILVILIPLSITGVLMVNQAEQIVTGAVGDDGWLQTFDLQQNALFKGLPNIVQAKVLAVDIAQVTDDALDWVIKNLGNIFSGTANVLLQIVIFFIALYYMLSDREKLYEAALRLSPFKDTLDRDILKRIVSTVRGVVFGALIIAIVQGILAAIGMTIFGVPGALIWGAAVVIAAEVPLLGVGLVMIPVVLYLLVTGSTGAAIGLLIWSAVVVGLVDNLLAPILIKGKTNMHALLILISVLGGLELFGPVGFIIGPTVLAAVMVVMELYMSGILGKRKA